MYIVYLPYAIEKVIKVLSYVLVVVLDILHFALTPFTWIKTKAHIILLSFAGISYTYFRFMLHNQNALLTCLIVLLTAVTTIAVIKMFRKLLHTIRRYLMKIVYSPLGVCIRIKPLFFQKHRPNHKNITDVAL